MRYAAATTVPVERSRAEIEETLRRHGASEFHSGWKADAAMVAFRIDGLLVRFVLPLPAAEEERFTHKKDRDGFRKRRTEWQARDEWQQEVRQRWRALLLAIKAKLEAVESGISTVEKEFLAFIVLSDDTTFGDWVVSEALPQIRSGQMPRLALPAPEPDKGEVIDAEFEQKP